MSTSRIPTVGSDLWLIAGFVCMIAVTVAAGMVWWQLDGTSVPVVQANVLRADYPAVGE